MREISLSDYAMGREEHFHAEWLVAKPNAEILLKKVNAFLTELEQMLPGWHFTPVVSSGFRPSEINSQTANAARRSLHMTGQAIDLADKDGSFKLAFQPLIIKEHAELLKKHDLWMEHPSWTLTWVHFDDSTSRADRPIRVFIPK